MNSHLTILVPSGRCYDKTTGKGWEETGGIEPGEAFEYGFFKTPSWIIELLKISNQDINIEIINMHGIRVLKKNIQVSGPDHIKKINLRPFSNGIYLIRILNNIDLAHKTIIINK